MAETTNYNLYKPQAGESGWAQALNNNLDVIDAQMKSNQDGISNHTGTGSNKHNADQIKTANGSNVESEIAALISGKADVNHTHNYASANHSHLAEEVIMPDNMDIGHHINRIDSDISTIENTLDLMIVDLTPVTISASIYNRMGGIRLICNTSPVINITYWIVTVSKDGITICEGISSSNIIFIAEDLLVGVEDGDTLNVAITAVSGQSSKSRTYNHVYHHVNNSIENRLDAIEAQLTIGNIIDAFAQDADALQALANVLHSSNTLAQKVAELSQI
ncbi:MAG: hypothetical protein APR54_12415 [Candidatus Cloacimonas sp. SDB]|nr:MAG: hypothetical protein APR54_12415 [Candidatus Cloacimonas sp. SDB]